MNYQDTRTVDGFQVEIVARGDMRFVAPPASGCQWEIAPGVTIRVRNPFAPYSEPLAEQLYRAPTRGVFHPEKRNTLGQLGAYVSQWPEWDTLMAWIDKRVELLVAKATRELAVRIADRERRIRIIREILRHGARSLSTEDYDCAAREAYDAMDREMLAEELETAERQLDRLNQLYAVVPIETEVSGARL